ncbi:MAG: hypothetical protein ACJ739_00035 [Acidimicrobiales bacterium]
MPADRVRRRAGLATVALLGIASLAACSEDTVKDQSLCTVYGEYLDHLEAIRDLDAQTLSAEDASEVVEGYVESVVRVQHATEDDRNNNGLLSLEAAARDLLRTLESVRDDAEYETWSPLVEDDLKDVRNAALLVDEALAAECPEAGDLR